MLDGPTGDPVNSLIITRLNFAIEILARRFLVNRNLPDGETVTDKKMTCPSVIQV
ncbi:MAG TPA: hypothetical protein VF258_11075 [Luteolibacter sp.]